MGWQHLRGDIDGLSSGDVAMPDKKTRGSNRQRVLQREREKERERRKRIERKAIVEDKGGGGRWKDRDSLSLINLRKIKNREMKKNSRYHIRERWHRTSKNNRLLFQRIVIDNVISR